MLNELGIIKSSDLEDEREFARNNRKIGEDIDVIEKSKLPKKEAQEE